eukprot:g530.t1
MHGGSSRAELELPPLSDAGPGPGAMARHLSVLETGSDVLEVIAEREGRVRGRIGWLACVAVLAEVVFGGLGVGGAAGGLPGCGDACQSALYACAAGSFYICLFLFTTVKALEPEAEQPAAPEPLSCDFRGYRRSFSPKRFRGVWDVYIWFGFVFLNSACLSFVVAALDNSVLLLIWGLVVLLGERPFHAWVLHRASQPATLDSDAGDHAYYLCFGVSLFLIGSVAHIAPLQAIGASFALLAALFLAFTPQINARLVRYQFAQATGFIEHELLGRTEAKGTEDFLAEFPDLPHPGTSEQDVSVLRAMCQAIPALRKLRGWAALQATATSIGRRQLEGITVNSHGRVTRIELAGRGLEGSIRGVRFQDLSMLHVLKLSNNKLEGDLPRGMGAGFAGGCCPRLITLAVDNNSGIGGEVCLELLQKVGANLMFFRSGRRIKTPFLVGVSLASESIPQLLLFNEMLKEGERTQGVVLTVGVGDQDWASPDRSPEHRCIRTGKGSGGSVWNPWQKVWLDGIDRLAATASIDEPAKCFVVCHARHPDLLGVFEEKLGQGDITPGHSEWADRYWKDSHPSLTKWQMDDFDAKFALAAEEATSILDWERRAFQQAIDRHEGKLQPVFINERGVEMEAPDWYGLLRFQALAPAGSDAMQNAHGEVENPIVNL